MDTLILSSRRSENPYADTEQTYVFPRQYLPRFEPLTRGADMLALIYEPRRGGGRESYVAWAVLTGPPTALPDGLFEVRYDGRLIPLPRLCRRVDVEGQPFELRLKATPKAQWGSVLQGQSVRPISVDEAVAILTAGGVIGQPSQLPTSGARATELVRRSIRDRGFRGQVLAAYGFRCAVTGFAAPANEARALLDAAHIRPVSASGSDHVRNGLSLSAGVHRLYDEGLVTFGYAGGGVRLEVSPWLSSLTLTGQGGQLRLEPDTALILPTDERIWPDPDALAWHGTHVFRR